MFITAEITVLGNGDLNSLMWYLEVARTMNQIDAAPEKCRHLSLKQLNPDTTIRIGSRVNGNSLKRGWIIDNATPTFILDDPYAVAIPLDQIYLQNLDVNSVILMVNLLT